jgi:hypothetical protein
MPINKCVHVLQANRGHCFIPRTASKLLGGASVADFNCSNASSRSKRSQSLTPSIATGRGNRPSSTSSRNLVLPMSRYSAAWASRRARGQDGVLTERDISGSPHNGSSHSFPSNQASNSPCVKIISAAQTPARLSSNGKGGTRAAPPQNSAQAPAPAACRGYAGGGAALDRGSTRAGPTGLQGRLP